MKKLIIAVILIFIAITSVFSQDAKIKISENPKLIRNKTLSFSILQGITILDPVAMDYMQFDIGYFILKNFEIGICIGKENPQYENFAMIGVHLSHHTDEGFHTGLRIAYPVENSPKNMNTYNEINLGKDFSITNKFNLRMNISYSYMSKTILGFNGDFKYKRFGFEAGFNYVF